MPPPTRRLPALAALLLGACAGPGLFTDGTSVSFGAFNHGVLRRGRPLPVKGEGYVIPALWAARGARFGTDEIVEAIRRAARRVRREYPGGTLGVGDLSLKGGGDSVLHRSHENGRDADLIWFAVDERERPLPPVDSMPRYGADLRARPPAPTPGVVFGPYSPRRFDVKRNWALVRALVQDPRAEVQYLFCHELLKQTMLAWARTVGEDEETLERADALLRQPGDSLPHDDHLHLRIYCAADDRALGCSDRGPQRWWKKRWKYMPPDGEALAEERLVEAALRLPIGPPY